MGDVPLMVPKFTRGEALGINLRFPWEPHVGFPSKLDALGREKQ